MEVEHCVVTILAIFVVISQGIFFWGLGYNAVERETASSLVGIFGTAFAFLLAYLVGFPFIRLSHLCLHEFTHFYAHLIYSYR